MARVSLSLIAICAASALLSPLRTRAQDDESFALDESAAPVDGASKGPLLGDEQALEEERAPNERFRESTDPYEDPERTYVFFGAGYHFARVPSWLLPAYHVKEGPGVSMPLSLSGELAYRKKGFQVTGAINYTKLNFTGPFQLTGDPITDTEWIHANLKMLNVTAAVTWSTSFTDWFALEYGFEAGLGVMFGDMVRNEAYKSKDGKWHKCDTWASQTTNPNDALQFNPKFPNPTPEQQRYCDIPVGDPNVPPPATNSATMRGAQYGVHARHGLFHGGIPHVIPIVGPRLSLRFKPIHQVVVRVDVPVPVIPFGFMGGVTVQYGL